MLCAFVLSPAFAGASGTPPAPNLTLLSDRQMLLPLARVGRAFSVATGTPITVVLKDDANVATQIEQGIDAHVLITADTDLLHRLIEQGLTDVTSRRAVAQTPVVLISVNPLSNQAALAKRISFASMLAATPNQPIITAPSDSPDGACANALLQKAEYASFAHDRVEPQLSVNDVLETLRDSDSLGILLMSDVVAEPDLRVLSTLPTDQCPPVRFEAIVLASESMDTSKKLLQFLSSREALQLLSAAGFQAVTR
jgi:molybdenum ABC transporter molybdate-binding protein